MFMKFIPIKYTIHQNDRFFKFYTSHTVGIARMFEELIKNWGGGYMYMVFNATFNNISTTLTFVYHGSDDFFFYKLRPS